MSDYAFLGIAEAAELIRGRKLSLGRAWLDDAA